MDDPRNTDNAWMETVAMNFHDDTGTVTKGERVRERERERDREIAEMASDKEYP